MPSYFKALKMYKYTKMYEDDGHFCVNYFKNNCNLSVIYSIVAIAVHVMMVEWIICKLIT